ncbi:hypothetical protein J14TS2_33530 [Bacillus sp. J14TS2]|uniref:DUF3889 domain-containing protein n=1 Tax=Bacillus sp. J14TS2 TaxID=2807188 RepID=UPI001B121E3C|nr:DUF3889 domain-containing protein [Bacillus sp. J14TS2]GIN72878.1 hypothetical protein J14TS2_33530 [Bacillus sp. J14TS2]
MKTLFVPLVMSLFFLGNFVPLEQLNTVKIAENEPSYAKWGKLAMEKTKEKYPQADIVDYLHVGREIASKYSTEKFKLWLKSDDKEFGVFVNIKFDNKTEEIINITYRKTNRSFL